ncbi:PQQ-like beta-propeller repeat protein [Actinoallomurus sp. NBC_01490]|uniref:outer membrane protein assembly factor BamB family protein n=1 Tax=Actinoallomurus sp. NBC_01490 TaxID=2903557 RepID=UPI002E34FB36|nr:PQQ-binding-like beta-propeller repeat protein [Actinoallomurus sp. NBC_01490]
MIGAAGYAIFSAGGDGGTTARGGLSEGAQRKSGHLKGKVLWQSRHASQDLSSYSLGGWHTTDLTVAVAPQGLVAYDSRTGRQRWQMSSPPLPGGDPSLICGVSTETGGNVGVIGFGPDDGDTVTKCKEFALIDLATGRARGQGTLPSGIGLGSKTMSAEVIDGTAVIEYDGGLTGFDLSGHQRWRLDVKAAVGDRHVVSDLLPGAGAAMVLFDGLDSDDTVTVAQVSPRDGTVAKKAPVALPSDVRSANVQFLSTRPVVLSGSSGDHGAFISLDDAFRVKATIAQTGTWGTLDMSGYSHAGHDLIHAAVSSDTLVVGTSAETVSSTRETNKIMAFDLATGRQRWATSLGPEVTSVPVAFDGDAVLAMINGTYENPPQVFRLAITDGKATPIGPAYSQDFILAPETSRMYWDGSRIFGVSLSAKTETPSAYALG